MQIAVTLVIGFICGRYLSPKLARLGIFQHVVGMLIAAACSIVVILVLEGMR